MRAATILIISASAAVMVLSASPPPASAQNPGRIFGALTSPLRMMMGGGPRRHFARSSRHRSAARASARHERAAAIRHAREERRAAARAQRNQRGAMTAAAAAAGAGMLWPTASASAYEDMLGYALLPNEYGDRFWSHGVNDIMSAMMAPQGAFASAHAHKAAATDGMCSAQAYERADQPVMRIAQTLELTDPQRQAFDELRIELKKAVEREKSSCRDQLPATAAERARALADGLWSLHYTASYIRAPLEQFYASLNDEQKAKLAGDPKAGTQACAQAPANVPESVAELAKFLAPSCPQQTPPSPVARLDAASERLASMAYAAMSIDPARIDAGRPRDRKARSSSLAR